MPPRKRANGEGSLYKRASDGLWVGSVTLPNGRRKYVSSKTQKGAREKLKQLRADLAAGRPVTTGRGLSLGEYLTTEWIARTLPQRVAAGRLAQRTLASYEANVRLHIVPHLGHVVLTQLSPGHLRDWLVELQDKPSGNQPRPTRENPNPAPRLLSDRMVAYCHAILRKALSDAMADELVTRNVATLVEPPHGQGRGRALTAEETSRLLEAAAGDRWADLWVVILGMALRRGEALALEWSRIDLDRGLADVGPSLQRIDGKLRIMRGKTARSHATVAVPPLVVQVLRDRYRRQQEEIRQAEFWQNPNLVFATRYGTLVEPRNANRAWEALCRKAGVANARIHDLRHTAATWLYEAGAELKDIQRALRHSRLATTSEIYTHFTEETVARTTAAMDGALRRLQVSTGVEASTEGQSTPKTVSDQG